MIFEIHCQLPRKDAVDDVYLYNNQTNEVWSPEGDLIDFNPTQPIKKTYKINPIKPFEPIRGKSRHIKTLKLQLGLACNYHCEYCVQAQFRTKNQRFPSHAEVDAFFNKFDKAGLSVDPKGRVELWGGEPFVYWKAIRYLIPKMKEKWGNELEILIITNGSLITYEIADFLVKHRVNVVVSHDGPGFKLRNDKDPMKDPEQKAIWKYLDRKMEEVNGQRLGYLSVITPENRDMLKLREFFDENLGEGTARDIEGIVSNLGLENQSMIFTPQMAKELDTSIFRALILEAGRHNGLEQRALTLEKALINRMPVNTFAARCNNGRQHVLVVDLQGNVLSCQSRTALTNKIGHLDEFDNIENKFFKHWEERHACKNCMVLTLCHGVCPNLTNREVDVCCKNEFILHAAIFSATWYRLTGRIITKTVALQG